MAIMLAASATMSGTPLQPQESPRRHTITVDGHPIAVWEKLPAEPKGAILLIHGRTWSGVPDFDLQVPGENLSLMDRLVAEGYAVYAQDLRGYGGTPRDSTEWATPDRSVADVAAVLRWIQANGDSPGLPVLFGWSYGSMVSQLTAQRHEDLMSVLVLYGYPVDPDWELPNVADTADLQWHRNTPEAAASDFITPGTISDRAVQVYIDAALAADPVRTDWRRVHQFNALNPAEVGLPTLLIHGEFDPFAPIASQARQFSRLGHPDRRWVVVPNADHAAHLEHPGRFIRELVGFLQRGGG
ncbi:MAG: alpha/beta fold hydrolase [Gemmatimonadetes bacterium]|nr:alpha/beta fold hydrolase [Gemmatimonadota bacterium]